MPKCRNCKWMIGYEAISHCFICSATDDIEFIEPQWAEDEELGCDLFVNSCDDDATA